LAQGSSRALRESFIQGSMDPHHGSSASYDKQQSGDAAAVRSALASPVQEPIAFFRTELRQKREDRIQPEAFSSSESFASASEHSGTYSTFSSASASCPPTDPMLEVQLRSRLEDCLVCKGQQRVRRWSDEEPSAAEYPEGHETTARSGASIPVTDLALEDQRSLEEILAECGLWSTGSTRHITGKCRPCHYVRSNTGCESGQSCEFCHFPHTGKSRRQLSMSSRLYCKSFADALSASYRGRPDQLKRAAATSATGSSYLASIFEDRFRRLPETSAIAHEHTSSRMLEDAPSGSPSRSRIVSL